MRQTGPLMRYMLLAPGPCKCAWSDQTSALTLPKEGTHSVKLPAYSTAALPPLLREALRVGAAGAVAGS